jgi:hypothetical protein
MQYSARPEMYAIRVKRDVGEGTRWEIVFWPTPDASYSLQYRYRTNPTLLSTGLAKPVGGMPHAQTVIQSCLLSADELMGKRDDGKWDKYLILLQASVSHDRTSNAPQTLGYNRDGSDGFGGGDFRDCHVQVCRYNGQEY